MEMDWNAILFDPIRAFFGQLVGFLPNLLAVLAILVGGWIVAKVIRTVLVRLLAAVKADSLAERIQSPRCSPGEASSAPSPSWSGPWPTGSSCSSCRLRR